MFDTPSFSANATTVLAGRPVLCRPPIGIGPENIAVAPTADHAVGIIGSFDNAPSLLDAVVNIIPRTSKKEVIWINALSNIAAMAYQHPIGYFPDMDHERYAVGTDPLARVPERPVSSRHVSAYPQPAPCVGLGGHFGEKSSVQSAHLGDHTGADSGNNLN